MKLHKLGLGLLILASCDATENGTQSHTGGTTASGGTITGGTTAEGGTPATSGSTSTGGNSASGGNSSTGGTLSAAGGSGSGGNTASSSSGGSTTGGSSGSVGSSAGGSSATGGSAAAGGTTSAAGSMAVDGGAGRDGGGADLRPADGSADRIGDARGGDATGGGGTGTGGSGGTGIGGAGGTTTGGSGGTATGGSAGTGGNSSHVGFYVNGRYLYDICGEKVVLRGVNEMVIYSSSQDGTPYFSEIAKTGANSVRITWNTSGSATKLEAAIKNAIAAQMIPMPVLNDATGDMSKLNTEITYWVRSDILAIIKTYQDKLLINVGNEVGNGSVTDAAFTTAYTGAISQMRTAGIHTPLVIDGSSWGQNIDQLQSTGPGLLTADPDHNLIFSCHMYWNDPNGTKVTTEIAQTVSLNLPLIVGEFAQHAVSGCSSSPFAYKVLLSVAQTSEIGWLPWSWGGVKNSDCASDQPFDMTSNGTYAGLQGWGLEVAVTDPNSIQNTSKRSKYMTTGSCN
jgi:mannan endo-1,4-beta-mannosidase